MLVIPAIDLRSSKVVRLFRGAFDQVSVYSEDPVEVARSWQEKGAQKIHVVDLDGAESGALQNVGVLKKILGAVTCPIQFGGGVRTRKAVDEVMKLGAQNIILSTAVFEDLDMVREAVCAYPDRILVSVDTQDGLVRARGWKSSAPLSIERVSQILKEIGIRTVIHTNVARDGTLEGLDLVQIKSFLERSGLKVIVAGGVASVEDIRGLKNYEKEGVTGVIVGRALYEGRVDLKEALGLC